MFTQLKWNIPTRKWFLIGSLTLIIFSCRDKTYSLSEINQPLIIGQATPIQLDLEVTKIILADYVLNPYEIDSITTDGPFSIEIDNSVLVLIGRPKLPLYTLTFWSNGAGETVLLKRTKKTLYSLVYNEPGDDVKIKGEFNAWNPNSTVLERKGNGFSTYLLLSPGSYQYLYVVDGKEVLDPMNPDSVSNGMGGWNSVINIKGPDREELPILTTHKHKNNTIYFESTDITRGTLFF